MTIDTHLGCPLVYMSIVEYNDYSDKESCLPIYDPFGKIIAYLLLIKYT